MNCEQLEELAGAYALGALPSVEATKVAAHLESCDRHAELPERQSVAASLALAAEEVAPPPTLKSRLMAAIEAEGAIPQRRDALGPHHVQHSAK